MRGPGEKEIETDRRVIRDKISRLKDKLEQIDKQSVTQRKSRDNSLRCVLVGYTNVGKSSIMNRLCKSDLLAENKLFATLDSTVRKLVLSDPELPEVPPTLILLSDTVGFIRKLPHQLIESFKSTLDEIKEADILIHVVDISHHGFEDQMQVVEETLQEIGASDKTQILVFNKIDAYNPEATSDDIFEDRTIYDLKEFERMWIAKRKEPVVFISATENNNMDALRMVILKEAKALRSDHRYY
jgi:GTP-binding protein HflX